MDKVYLVTHEIVTDSSIKTESFVHKTHDGARRHFVEICDDMTGKWYEDSSYDYSDIVSDEDENSLCLYEHGYYDFNRETVMIQELELQD